MAVPGLQFAHGGNLVRRTCSRFKRVAENKETTREVANRRPFFGLASMMVESAKSLDFIGQKY
jgi:hypothetical protein